MSRPRIWEHKCTNCGRTDHFYAKGLCKACYMRLRRKGTLEYSHPDKHAPRNNAYRIRHMTDEELAEWIFDLLWRYDAIPDKTTEDWLRWLKEEDGA